MFAFGLDEFLRAATAAVFFSCAMHSRKASSSAVSDGLRPEIDSAAFDCYACSDVDLFVFKGSQAISKYTSLEAVVKGGWSADPQERPSFEELEPALHALSMVIEQQQEERGGKEPTHRLTD